MIKGTQTAAAVRIPKDYRYINIIDQREGIYKMVKANIVTDKEVFEIQEKDLIIAIGMRKENGGMTISGDIHGEGLSPRDVLEGLSVGAIAIARECADTQAEKEFYIRYLMNQVCKDGNRELEQTQVIDRYYEKIKYKAQAVETPFDPAIHKAQAVETLYKPTKIRSSRRTDNHVSIVINTENSECARMLSKEIREAIRRVNRLSQKETDRVSYELEFKNQS